jgi:hypothetical protein
LINLISSVVNLTWWFFCDSLIHIRIGMDFLWFDLIWFDLIESNRIESDEIRLD